MKQIILQVIDADELYQQIRLIVKEEINAAESKKNIASNHLTAFEFMSAIKIRRTKFDELVKDDKIQIIKKGRTIMCRDLRLIDTSMILRFDNCS